MVHRLRRLELVSQVRVTRATSVGGRKKIKINFAKIIPLRSVPLRVVQLTQRSGTWGNDRTSNYCAGKYRREDRNTDGE